MINSLRGELFSSNAERSSSQVADCSNNIVEVDTEAIKILIFSHIRNGLLACKPLADAWHKNLSHSSTYTEGRFVLCNGYLKIGC